MRLWHEHLIPLLPARQLLGQHRECAALRGNGWNKKHATVDYVFLYNPYRLVRYHYLVIREMVRRGYRPDPAWLSPIYRGRNCPAFHPSQVLFEPSEPTIYPDHNSLYLEECIANLKNKGAVLLSEKQMDEPLLAR